MQPFQYVVSENAIKEQVLEKAIDFFVALAGEAREAFLAQIRAKYGADSYDLLKNYSVGVKNFPMVYKQQILDNILPFLPTSQAFDVVRLECSLVFQLSNIFSPNSHITEKQEFINRFLHFAREVQKTAIFDDVCPRYFHCKADVDLICQVERVLLLQKLCKLYEDICTDIDFVCDNLLHVKNSLEDVSYHIPCLQVTLHIAGLGYVGKGNTMVMLHFDTRLLRKALTEIQDMVKNMPLPIIEGKFADVLKDYLMEQALQQEYQQSTVDTVSLAQYDAQNILDTYQKSNKLWQTMSVNIELQLCVGKVKTNISSGFYRKRVKAMLFPLILLSIYSIPIMILFFPSFFSLIPFFTWLSAVGISLYRFFNLK